MGTWIDFRALREQLDFARVLDYYQVAIKRRGSQGTAPCPLPKHPPESRSPSFSVSFQKNIFQCFGCGAKGNVLDFIACMERLNPRDPQEFRKAALLAQERMLGGLPPAKPATPTPAHKPPAPASAKLPVQINEPLDFVLKNLDPQTEYLRQRGFTEETIAHFGLGYCTKGTFAGRIVIPLHDLECRLVGYAGRIIFDDAIDEQNPKYLYPARRQREGKVLEFAKSLLLYHGHALPEIPAHDLIVVQGFPAAWWLWQNGHRNVVSLMGTTCSADQAIAIFKLTVRSARIWCFTDADQNGQKCAHNFFTEVGPHRFCKWIRPSHGQPTNCDVKQIDELLKWKIER
jgi:DNA primase